MQDMGLQKAGIGLELNKQKLFMPGEMYVTLSWIANLSGMYLKDKCTNSAIKVNKTVDEKNAWI